MRSSSRLGLSVLAAAALSNVARGDFTITDFTGSPVNPVANSSVLANGDLQMTPIATFMTGDAWYAVAQPLATGFSTSFRYSIDGGTGADGIAFVIQSASNVLVGGYGGFLGQHAGVPGASVNFVTYFGERAEVHASAIDLNPYNGPPPLAAVPVGVRGLHDVRIDYVPGTMRVYFDGASTPLLVATIDLTNYGGVSLLDSNGMAFIGFGSGTGSATDDHRIQSWSFSSGHAGTPYCFGDGSGTACPCGNVGASWRGCDNSFATGGGRLEAHGIASVASDSVQLRADFLPPTSSALFFQGMTQVAGGAGSTFGDGLRCVGGATVRMGTNFATGGSVDYGYGVPGNPLVSVAGGVPATGGTREYQVWYRNAPDFCTAATYNLTNAVTVQWTP